MANIFSKLFGRLTEKSYTLTQLQRALGSNSYLSDGAQMAQYGKSAYVYACVDKIAKYTSTIDLHLYQITNAQGDSKEVLVHPALDLLWRFNPYQTRSEFLRITVINKKLTGKAFWYKVRNTKGQVVELWNMRPDMVTVNPDDENIIKNYTVALENGDILTIEPDDMIFLRDPNPLNMYDGLSPVQAARSRIQTEEMATAFQRDFFMNNARPDGLLKTEEMLTGEQVNDMQENWEKKHRGRGRNSKVGILYGGLEYQQISLSQREMDYIESMKFTRDDILVAFGVPKSIITTDDVNRANAEAGLYMFLSQTIKPEMKQIVESLNEMLIIPEYGEQFYLDFTDPTPEDRTLRLNEYTQGVDKWITRNEIRSQIGLAPIEGGDELFGSIANVPIGMADQVAQADMNKAASRKNINGRMGLRVRFELEKELGESVEKSAKKPKKQAKAKGKKKEKTLVSILTDKGVRAKYYDMVNKLIDAKARRFKSGLRKEVDAQEKRVIEELKKAQIIKKKGRTVEKLSGNDLGVILNITNENKIFATFALPFMTEFLRSSGQDALDFVNADGKFVLSSTIEQKLQKRAEFFADSINTTTFDRLAKSLSEGISAGEGIREMSDRVAQVYDQYSEYRLELIARTESTYANNEGYLDGYSQSSVVGGKEWIATLDDRTREEHVLLDGEIVGLHDNFSNGVPYPQEYNCRCVIAPVISN